MYHFKICVLLSAGFGSTGFSFGTAASTAPSFSLGTGTTTTNSGFGFGGLSSSIAPSGTSAFGGFGCGFGSNQAATSNTSLGPCNPFGGFGGFGSTGTTATATQNSFQLAPAARPLFGQPQTTTPSLGEDYSVREVMLNWVGHFHIVRRPLKYTQHYK